MLKIDNLEVYTDNKKILDNVSFSINDNDKIGIVGINGTGKSTLLNNFIRLTKNNKKEETSKVVVDIKGMVTNPGVYEVDSTMRVNDVILLAGGLIEGADTSLINLAKIVTDEMTIIIYSNEEVQEKYKEEICVCDCPLIENDACVDNKEEDHLININTCTLDELMEINGIGKTKAEAILEYRESNGDFNSIDDIKKVDGIGDALFEKIKAYIKV